MATGRRTSEEIFHQALEITDGSEQARFLDRACGDDTSLRAEVDKLLKWHSEADSFLEGLPVGPQVTVAGAASSEGPGTVIGHYKLLEKIGEGGMAVVYMAEQKEPVRRRIALKIIKPGMDSREVIARFEAERQALAMMDHPHVAKVFDAGTTEAGRPYFVMELVRGVSITEYCDRNKLRTRERLDLFLQVCQGVQHAHQKGIIHRDIKPSNILVTLHEGRHIAVIIDFGIAKATSQQLTEKTLFTRYAQMIGTPEYMSPEQAEMSRLDIDTRTDIYSLGVLLYELLTGTTPIESSTLRQAGYAEIQRVIRDNQPPKPSTRLSTLGATLTETAQRRQTSPEDLRRSIKGDLDWIVMKSMDKDRSRRYETAHELAQDIERHLNDEPIKAGPPSALDRCRKFVRRNRALVTGGVAVAAALIVGLIVSTALYVRAETSRQREAEARSVAEQAEQTANEQQKLAEQRQIEAEAARDEAKQYAETIETIVPFYEYDQAPIELSYARMGMDLPIDMLMSYMTRNFQKEFKGPPLLRAKAYGFLGHLHEHLTQFSKASSYFEKVLDLRRQGLGEGDPLTIVSANNLALVYVKMKKWTDADPLLVNSLQTSLRVLGDHHNVTIDSRVCMAKYLQAMGHEGTEQYKAGEYEAATRLLARVDDLWRSVLERPSEEIPELACLAMAQYHSGHITEADASLSRLRDIEDKKEPLLEQDERCLWEAEKTLTGNNSVLAGIWEQIEAGQLQQARERLAQAKTAADPKMEGQMNRLARALARMYYIMGRRSYRRDNSLQETISNYKESVSIDPAFAIAWNDLARLQATSTAQDIRNSARAIENAIRACEIAEWRNPLYVDTLAAAYAEAGDFDAAVSWQKKAISLFSHDDPSGNPIKMNSRLNLYESRRPYRNQEGRGLVAWWKFDEPSGQEVIDSSGNGLHGRLIGNPQRQTGMDGGALVFDGKNDYVDCSNNPAFDITDEITLAAWIRVSSFTLFCQGIISKGDSAWMLQRCWEFNSLDFNCRGTSAPASSEPEAQGKINVNDGQWHHVAATYDGSRVCLYVDGRLDNAVLASGRLRLNDSPVYIGHVADGPIWAKNRYWHGLIDDVRIYSYAFTAEDIERLYHETVSKTNQN